MKILQISSELNVGSIGKISEHISDLIINEGWESFIAYGREGRVSNSKNFKIGRKKDLILHGLGTRVFDNHGFYSIHATKKLVKTIKQISPDIIHLHHLHGYYVNVKILFDFLKTNKTPIIWTFHDCWSFTGHCTHYEFVQCDKWKTQCSKCPQKKEYPQSFIWDNSFNNFLKKKELFNSVENLTIVPVSEWLGEQISHSFLQRQKVKVIQNGIDLENFNIQNNKLEVRKKLNLTNEFLILGVASPFNKRKGFEYFIELSKRLSHEYKLLLVGLNGKQIQSLPSNIIGIERTESVSELAEFYSAADVFVNPTLEDTFPTTNLEAQACGTPVITFKSGGSPESIQEGVTGFIIEKGDLDALLNIIIYLKNNNDLSFTQACRERAVNLYDKTKNFQRYINLYKDILGEKQIGSDIK